MKELAQHSWYFVLQLQTDTRSAVNQFEVQLLDGEGCAIAAVQFARGAEHVVLADELVPEPVLRAAERCSINNGQYVNATGQLLDWIGQPL